MAASGSANQRKGSDSVALEFVRSGDRRCDEVFDPSAIVSNTLSWEAFSFGPKNLPAALAGMTLIRERGVIEEWAKRLRGMFRRAKPDEREEIREGFQALNNHVQPPEWPTHELWPGGPKVLFRDQHTEYGGVTLVYKEKNGTPGRHIYALPFKDDVGPEQRYSNVIKALKDPEQLKEIRATGVLD